MSRVILFSYLPAPAGEQTIRTKKGKLIMTLKKDTKKLTYTAAFLIFSIIFYLLPKVGDDIPNSHSTKLQTVTGIFSQDYHMFFSWTSRILINPIMYLSTTIFPKWLYATITGLLTTVIIYFVSHKQTGYKFYLAIFPGLLFPLVELGTAGYIATTVTYLYPIAFTLLGIITYNKHWYPLAGIFFLLGFNNEQVCIIAAVYGCYKICKSHFQKVSLWIIIPLALNFFLMIFAPGNHARKIAETKHWLPAFAHYNLIDKLDLGTITTIQHYLFGFSIPVIALSIFLLILKEKQHPVIAWMPFTVVLFTNLLVLLSSNPKKFASTINPSFGKTVLAVYLLGIAWLVSTLYLVNNQQLNILLLAGLLSRIALGFSPTIYASATRTFVFCDAIIIYLVIQLITKHQWTIKARPVVILLILIVINIILTIAIINHWSLIDLGNVPLMLWTNVM